MTTEILGISNQFDFWEIILGSTNKLKMTRPFFPPIVQSCFSNYKSILMNYTPIENSAASSVRNLEREVVRKNEILIKFAYFIGL